MSKRFVKEKNVVKKSQTVGITEPLRESLYDVLCDNLATAKKNIYVNRIIYVGEHTFEPENFERCSDVLMEIVKEINESYNDEPLTGLFISYKKFFVHMLEGSEDSIMKHIQLFKEDEEYSRFQNIKLVSVVHHINQRFIMDWTDVTGKPTTLLEKIDPDSDMEKCGKYILSCVQKVYQLGKEIREIRMSFERKEHIDRESLGNPSLSFSYESSYREDSTRAYFPEINLLQFLVQTRFLIDLEGYLKSYSWPNVADSYQDEVWPIPSTMVPYTVFDKPLDPCVNLPAHRERKLTHEILLDYEIQAEDNAIKGSEVQK